MQTVSADKVVKRSARKRLPRHIGFIPDGNRRWASDRGMGREAGYVHGLEPGLQLYEICRRLGIEEVSVYGFTQDNTRRPSVQTEQFRQACVSMAEEIARRGSSLLVLGDDTSAQFPTAAKTVPHPAGRGHKGELFGQLRLGVGS